ncbi:MAG: Gfo/Idh/MocA family oxidoreductase [Bacteroidota bacterium]|nr:Gfo/Idh/MocA family oxidoreductase [Bacteroidota bacterium]
MKSLTINWGIIGCGDVTEIKSGPAFNKVPNSRLVAVMRRDAVKAKDYAVRHNVPRWYNDATELINDPEVNAVYVATPPLYHEEYTIKALNAGKPVYVEKPMAIDANAAKRMAQAASVSGVKLCVAHYRRQQPLFLKIKSLLLERAVGDVRFVTLQLFQQHQSNIIATTEVNWRINPGISGGGLFYDLAPHQLDLMLYFFGRPKHSSGLSFNASGLYQADDTTCGQILFENGILFNGAWCFTIPQKRDQCEIIGTEGAVRFSIFDQQPLLVTKNGKESSLQFNSLPHVQQPMIQKVVDYFLGQADNPCTAEEGIEVMKMMEAFTLQP